MLSLGILRRAHGVRGEIKLSTLLPERYFSELTAIIAGGNRYEVEKMRPANDGALIKLKGIDDKTAADLIRGEAFIPDDSRPELDDGEYFLDDIRGAKVYTDDGALIGTVSVAERGMRNDLWSVSSEDKDVVFPVIEGLIKEIDLENKVVRVSRDVFDRVAVYED